MSKFNDLINQFQGRPTYLFALLGLALILGAFVAIKKVKFNTRLTTQIAIMLALATVLKMFTLYKLPFGGSVTIGSMVPIIIMALLYGPEVGFITGFLFGIIDLIFEPYIVHPVQLLFDYPLAFMALGLAGYIKNSKFIKEIIIKFTKASASSRQVDIIENILSAIIGILGRYVCHIISGVVFFASDAPKGTSALLYSITYNFSFLGIDALICIIILSLIPRGQIKKISRIK
jgi:thiamine transporter